MKKLIPNKWDAKIDEITNDFQNSFGKLSSQEINWKPNASTWSIAENMDHIIKTNKSYFSIVDKAKIGSYNTSYLANFGWIVNLFGRVILKGVDPNRRKKTKTFKMWEPNEKKIFLSILDEFFDHQAELKQLINHSSDLISKETVISSPVNKHVVYKLETAFDIIVNHERRHYNQALEVLNKENFPK
jgi:hypothetical protein